MFRDVSRISASYQSAGRICYNLMSRQPYSQYNTSFGPQVLITNNEMLLLKTVFVINYHYHSQLYLS